PLHLDVVARARADGVRAHADRRQDQATMIAAAAYLRHALLETLERLPHRLRGVSGISHDLSSGTLYLPRQVPETPWRGMPTASRLTKRRRMRTSPALVCRRTQLPRP